MVIYFTILGLLPLFLGVNLVLLEGVHNLYYSHIIALNYVLVYLVCIQSGVSTFSQSLIYFIYSTIIYTFFFIFQTVRSEQVNLKESTLIGYLVFYYLSCSFILINNYIYLHSEISTFNNSNLGAKNSAKIEDFVDRLLPKHVGYYEYR